MLPTLCLCVLRSSMLSYIRDNVQTAGHHWEPFSIMNGDVLYIIPFITQLLAKTKKYLHTVCLFTNTIRSVDQPSNSPPKTLTSLSNRVRCG